MERTVCCSYITGILEHLVESSYNFYTVLNLIHFLQGNSLLPSFAPPPPPPLYSFPFLNSQLDFRAP